MKGRKTEKISLPIIFIFVSLMIVFVYVQVTVFDLFRTSGDSDQTNDHDLTKPDDIKAAKGMFIYLKDDIGPDHFIDRSIPQRTLRSFYSLRAYSGASADHSTSYTKKKHSNW